MIRALALTAVEIADEETADDKTSAKVGIWMNTYSVLQGCNYLSLPQSLW